MPSFVQRLNADDARICLKKKKAEEGQEGGDLYRNGENTGKVGEGANECLRGSTENWDMRKRNVKAVWERCH